MKQNLQKENATNRKREILDKEAELQLIIKKEKNEDCSSEQDLLKNSEKKLESRRATMKD